MTTIQFLDAAHGTRIAYEKIDGTGPTILFLAGFKSDMEGTKAMALRAHAIDKGLGFLRFDYQGHGQSSGDFTAGTIGLWQQDTLAVIDDLTTGSIVLIGSSMGGWLALLAARARPDRVQALIGLAAAPDFTERLWEEFDAPTRQALTHFGQIGLPSDYDDEEPYIITRALIEDGRDHLLLTGDIPYGGPVRLIHGQRDVDVPWRTALEIADKLASDDVVVQICKSSDHRLSSDADIARLIATLEPLLRSDRG